MLIIAIILLIASLALLTRFNPINTGTGGKSDHNSDTKAD
jgi:hypothetical protein